MKDERFTIVTCSYQTPIVTECLLKSYYKYHKGVHRLTLIENSTDELTRDMLTDYSIPYVDGNKVLVKPENCNWAWTHYCGLDWAVQNCNTPYCLILDTDILFKGNIIPYFERFIDSDVVASGIHMKRGKPKPDHDYYMLPRLHPCFMLLDVNFFNSNNLTFDPYIDMPKEENECLDVGSYLYHMIYKLGESILPIHPTDKPFIHCEGLSWAKEDNKEKLDLYNDMVCKDLSDINITGKFIST